MTILIITSFVGTSDLYSGFVAFATVSVIPAARRSPAVLFIDDTNRAVRSVFFAVNTIVAVDTNGSLKRSYSRNIILKRS